MDSSLVVQLKSRFDGIAHTTPEKGLEFWYARDLMSELGYDRWENFSKVIKKAVSSCTAAGAKQDDHFRGVKKKVTLGSTALAALASKAFSGSVGLGLLLKWLIRN